MLMRANPISLSILGLGILMTLLSIYAFQHTSTRGSRMFGLFMASITLYVIGYSMELASLELNTMLFWSKIEYIGTNSFPNLFLMFALVYTGRKKWLTRRNVAILFIIPVIVLAAKFTDEFHHLVYAHAWASSGFIPLLGFTPGPVYALSVYSCVPVIAGIYLLLKYREETPLIYRQQATVIALSVIPPLLIFISYIIGYRPFPTLRYFDTNALLYPVWAIGIGWAVFRFRLFDLAPIAREALIEHLSDGVLVLDGNGRLVDVNPMAVKLMGWKVAPIGLDAAIIFSDWPELQAACKSPAIADTVKMGIHQKLGTDTLFFDLSITSLFDKQKKVIGRLIVIHDITDLKQMEKRLLDLSLIDDLTGLNNRRGFLVLSAQFMEMVKRMSLKAAVIFIDLDNMKMINDTYGHAEGDQALIDIAVLLRQHSRSSDILSRYGGDEFMAIGIESTPQSAETMLARLQEKMAEFNAESGRKYPLSISYGISHFDHTHSSSLESLIKEADQAMYDQKQAKKQIQPTL